jgi:Fis family transcriptional regulator
MVRSTHPTSLAASAASSTIAETSIEQLIRRRVELMLERLGDAPIAQLHELVMREAERGLLGLMLDRCAGNRGQAAELLGLHRNTLRQKIAKLGLEKKATPRPGARLPPKRAGNR